MQKQQKTWFYYCVTKEGIYEGEVLGIQEANESDEQAKEEVALYAQNIIWSTFGIETQATMVSDTALYTRAPNCAMVHISLTVIYPPYPLP